MSAARAVTIVALVASSGCATDLSLTRARLELRAGRLDKACDAAASLVGRSRRAERLDAMRLYIDCQSRRGEIGALERWAAGLSPGAPRSYARALVALARSPAALPAARAQLEAAARAWPESGEIPYRLGVILLADEQPRAARPWLERAFAREPSAASAVALAHVCFDLGELDKALEWARKSVAHNPTSRDIARGRALIRRIARREHRVPARLSARFHAALLELTSRDRPSTAIRLAHELLADHPELAAVHTLLGLAEVRLGNTARAVVALRRAARLDPADPINALYLAVIFESRSRLERAADNYRKARHFDPFNVRAASGLGRVLSRLKRASQAARAYDHLVALERGGHRALRLAGRAHLAAGGLGPAEERFSRLLAAEPSDYEANLRLAQILLRKHQRRAEPALLERARDHAQRAARVRPDSPEVRQLLTQLTGGR
ncbi:MAG: tetratricopeptide repeat protein [Myxococcales bacterium]|nr:tetratricopeptide repeat protein [Myxococcales bacterium]